MTQAELDAAKQEEFDNLVTRVNANTLAISELHDNIHDLEDRVAALESPASTGSKK